jgi:hypothetical protein
VVVGTDDGTLVGVTEGARVGFDVGDKIVGGSVNVAVVADKQFSTCLSAPSLYGQVGVYSGTIHTRSEYVLLVHSGK